MCISLSLAKVRGRRDLAAVRSARYPLPLIRRSCDIQLRLVVNKMPRFSVSVLTGSRWPPRQKLTRGGGRLVSGLNNVAFGHVRIPQPGNAMLPHDTLQRLSALC